MRHARAEALDQLEPLLSELRQLPGMKEAARGVFYRRGRAFLHFHEDAAGLFADLRADGAPAFERFDVTAEAGRAALLSAARLGL
ncbi:MAG: hypothetical protein Q7V15_01235 [Phenylobacterium sp.]|uniref:hypothetical protein n=1 Tax=Phenylobacterium sp. TaxID=1871053 RepID=UPI00272376D2|nr:hypothetical protein [Phenylobacterium sp.]MDO8899959.1 hypothetical protein [Phenylobacterium sp.]MDP2213078.1 hypothetical protein [Phenylobacterium sp.]